MKTLARSILIGILISLPFCRSFEQKKTAPKTVWKFGQEDASDITQNINISLNNHQIAQNK